MERLEFNYKGVIFEAEGYNERDTIEDPWFEIEAVYHKGEDITECLENKTILEMEDRLNMDEENDRALWDFLRRNDL